MISEDVKLKIRSMHAHGLSNGEIASDSELHVSRKTVDKYVNEYEEEQTWKLGDQDSTADAPKEPATKESDKVSKSELKNLRREVEYLRQEVEFLKKIMVLKSGGASFNVPDSPMDSKNPKDPKDTE